MPPRRRKPQNWLLRHGKWAVAGAAIADIATLGAGYYYYHQLKNSADFRQKVFNYDERYIDLYYRANEKYGDGKAREQDYNEWGVKKINSFSFSHLLF